MKSTLSEQEEAPGAGSFGSHPPFLHGQTNPLDSCELAARQTTYMLQYNMYTYIYIYTVYIYIYILL